MRFFFILYIFFSSQSFAVESQDWQSLINKSCEPSVKGRLYRMWNGELSLWAHVNVSMNSWINDQKYSSCVEKWCLREEKKLKNHIVKCKSAVVRKCRQAGGGCR